MTCCQNVQTRQRGLINCRVWRTSWHRAGKSGKFSDRSELARVEIEKLQEEMKDSGQKIKEEDDQNEVDLELEIRELQAGEGQLSHRGAIYRDGSSRSNF